MSEELDVKIPWDADGLSEVWWREQGTIVNATALQTAFACCLHAGMNATASARAVKYSGSPESIRQAGYRAARSIGVQQLLSIAHQATGVGPSGDCDLQEVRSILSRIARQGDANSRLRACEALARIIEREQDAERQREPETVDIRAELAEIAAISPEMAEAYAQKRGIPWKVVSND